MYVYLLQRSYLIDDKSYTYEKYDRGGIPHCPTMENFAEIVGSSATLIVER